MATIPYEVYKLIEEEVGKEKAERIGKIIEETLTTIEQRVYEYKPILKAEIKEELTKELATKADIAEVRSEISEVRSELKAEIAQVRVEFKEEIKNLEVRFTKEIESIKSDLRVIKVLIYALFLLIVLLNGDKFLWVLDFIKLIK